jgi:hypothetical protein
MDASEWTSIIAVLISLGSLTLGLVSLRRAQKADERAERAEQFSIASAKTQAFVTFRTRFLDIKHGLPTGWTSDSYRPQPGTDEWRLLEDYWQNAFDEWFVPNVLNKAHLSDLWDLFFASAVRGAMANAPLRYVAWRLYEMGEFGEYREQYKRTLDELYGGPIEAAFLNEEPQRAAG